MECTTYFFWGTPGRIPHVRLDQAICYWWGEKAKKNDL